MKSKLLYLSIFFNILFSGMWFMEVFNSVGLSYKDDQIEDNIRSLKDLNVVLKTKVKKK